MLVLCILVALRTALLPRTDLTYGLARRNAFQPLFSAFCPHLRCVHGAPAYTYAH